MLILGVDSPMSSDPTATAIELEAAGFASTACTESVRRPLAVGSTITEL